MKIFLVIFLIILEGQNIFGQNNVNWNFPFKVGTIFTYQESITAFPNYGSTRYFRSTVDNEAIYYSKKYFHITYYNGVSDAWWRYDTLSGNLFLYDNANSCPLYNHEKLVDSLGASLGDTSRGCGSGLLSCISASNRNVFNQICFYKVFSIYQTVANGYSSFTRNYAVGFGSMGIESSSHGGGGTGSSSTSLIGCVINGIVYGDTSLVHISPPPPPQPDTESPKYFNAATGNKYFYESIDSSHNTKVTSIINGTIINSKKYYFNTYNNSWVRYDSASRNIIKVSSANCGGFNGFQKVDSLAAGLNNVVIFCTGDSQKVCTRIADSNIYNTPVKLKTFTRSINGKKLSETYAYNFSLIRFDVLDSLNNVKTYRLKGLIYYSNNQRYQLGDTSAYYFDTLTTEVKNINLSAAEDKVTLYWSTPYERLIQKYEIEKYKSGTLSWIKTGEINAKSGYTNSPNSYSLTQTLDKEGEYYFRIKLIYTNGSSKYFYSDGINFSVDNFKMFQNYPNPFNGTSQIKFKIKEAGFVNLSIYNSAGKKEFELISEKLDPGYYTRKVSSDRLASGVHFARLKAVVTLDNIYTETKKLVVIK